ncbi:MAG TPA: sigma-70 family RNA polymerase sigma factor, partial [Gemmataceae bacterium]|nr:sigma-70 family RNA polymerase sigma factor [Gemmataceae bacterium]
MSRRANGALLHYLDSLCATPEVREQTDGQLLERFVRVRDEAAFAALLRRHGPLVLRVCRTVLRHEQDAEDAFQATFLVLALRADSVRKGRSLGSWLYGVAQRTALAADRRARRRRKYEQRVPVLPEIASPLGNACVEELRRALDEETARLPEKYRLPFLLCCLEGKSRQAAARDLGWPEGTLSSRLAEARRLLEQQLSRRGFLMSAVLATGLVSTTVPAALARETARAALALTAASAGMAAVPVAVLALTKGVSKTMFLSKIKAVVALTMVLGVLGVGAGLSAQAGRGPGGDGPAQEERANPLPRDEDVRAEVERIEGLLRAQRWGDVQARTERLLAGDRALATRALNIILRNPKLVGRTHVLAPIGRKRFKEGVPLVIDQLADTDHGVRSWSIDVLGMVGDRSAVAPLKKQLRIERNRGLQPR